MEVFLDAMIPLGERLGPLLLMQFPYVARGQDDPRKRVRQRVH